MTKQPRKLTRFGPQQAPEHLGLHAWQWKFGQQLGVIPAPDRGSHWSAAAVEEVGTRLEAVRAAVGEQQPIGATKCAAWLREHVGLDVTAHHIRALADRGLLPAVDRYEEWPLYDVRTVERVAVEQLAPDSELYREVRAKRLVAPAQACELLGIRRTEFDYLELAGLITARSSVEAEVSRRIFRMVPLYLLGELDALREVPGLDWEQLTRLPRGAHSPLRKLVRERPPTRAQSLRRFVAELGQRHSTEVWARYDVRADGWELDWADPADGQLERDTILAAIAADEVVSQYADQIVVSTAAGAAVRWAREMVEPGAACVLDTETTSLDGAIVEVAIVDACTGEVLLNTLVDPGMPIEVAAYWIHGISDQDVASAPAWPQVLARVVEATAGRTVLAYNAEFDRGRIAYDCARHGVDGGELVRASRWGCVMDRRSDHERRWRWMPLGGGHRALGDALRARAVLLGMTATPPR